MATVDQATLSAARLRELAVQLAQQSDFTEVASSLASGDSGTFGGVWGSARALVAAALSNHAPGAIVVVSPHPADVDIVAGDIRLFTDRTVRCYPASESSPGDDVRYDDIYIQRARIWQAAAQGELPPIVSTSIQSLLQPVPIPETLLANSQRLAVGGTLDEREFLQWLTARGCESTTAVDMPGEFSLRGGILDLFPPDADHPYRVELFGDEIESIRQFDVATQRSLDAVDSMVMTMLPHDASARGHIVSLFPPDTWFILVESADIEEEGKYYLQRSDHADSLHGLRPTLAEIYKYPLATASGIPAGSFDQTVHLQFESVERFSGEVSKVRDELEKATTGQEVLLLCENEAEIERLREVFEQSSAMQAGRLKFAIGHLHHGFRMVSTNTTLISTGELFQRAELVRTQKRQVGRIIDSFLDLREGDLVVHLTHGIGRYRGLKLLEKEGREEEHLELEYRGGTKIYVPGSRIELVQKYVGGTKTKPRLAQIGGKAWVKQKEAARKAVIDLASEMIELQATRDARPGVAFPADTAWQTEFDNSFPYVETPDQLTAISDIKGDMQLARPMDRLLCGDVGFGKTEMALRAAFKAVDAGYQVAVLVPTTVLAEQHRRTFAQRMAEFPFEIASLSRFCTAKEQREILERTEAGAIDIVIGTHRLASHDVMFHNLGLLIIDEEQRFGVDVKQRLKALRASVDVLTMTATPIPRTLHMSLLGIRSISNLETPPADRIAVETRVVRFQEEMIRHAIIRELNRDGQVYFIHNRIQDIKKVAHRLGQIVPEARIRIGHGQMPEGELEDVMLGFVRGDFDILLATTIVESGLDIPNANTIFIDEADRYGLADLHQLRGRVGRYKHRAYCYLLVDEGRHLSPLAARRLRAIEEFSHMGAGFSLAMRDLELRGAGNILGTQQSGHIASVGYEMYCALLEQAVRQLKSLPPKETVDVNIDLPGKVYLPDSYISDLRSKIDLYRRLARLTTLAAVDEFAGELGDRFGGYPPVVANLLERSRLRIRAHSWSISDIHLEDDYAVFRYGSRSKMLALRSRSKMDLRVVDNSSAYLPLREAVGDQQATFELIKSLLQTS